MMLKSGTKRDKKCVRCKRAFYDNSWAASAKYCGNQCQKKVYAAKYWLRQVAIVKLRKKASAAELRKKEARK